MDTRIIDADLLDKALERLGEVLQRQGCLAELAVYGGSALLLQFETRRGTKDVDAVIREGHGAVIQARDQVARDLGLPQSWLNENVSTYVSQKKDADGTLLKAAYPTSGRPALRVFVARPEYLLAMKVIAARGFGSDTDDAIMLARHLNLESVDAVRAVVADYFPDHKLSDRSEAFLLDLEGAFKGPEHG